MKISLLLTLFLAAASSLMGQVKAQDSLNMTLFGYLNPVDSVGPHSALWGYTAPDGREYALFGSQIGTHIVDITEKPIKQVAFIAGPRNPWREIKVYRQYAYIVCESHDSGSGLQIVDLSDLPRSAALVRTDSSSFISAHTIHISQGRLFANGTQAEGGANGGAIILDLTEDPTHPKRLGQVTPYYFHDSFARNDTLIGAAVYGQGCDIWDISNPAAPVRLANFNYPYSGTHNAEITSDGGFIGTSDEINFTPKSLKIWDIRDLGNITKVAEYSPNPIDIIHNVHFIGRYAYVAWYTAGVRIIDMIDPFHPREVAFYDTFPGFSGSYSGVWEVYGWFPSGKVIASDRNTGLWVMNVDLKTGASLSGVVRQRGTGTPIAGVQISVPELKTTITTDNAGRYYVGGVEGAAGTMTVSRIGYAGITRPITLNGDREEDILLDTLELRQLVIRALDPDEKIIEGFSYAVEPYYRANVSHNGSGIATVRLPVDSTFTFTVGKWGYTLTEMEVTVKEEGQVVTARLEPGYQDNATLDLGWKLDDPQDRALTGRWVRIIPFMGYANAEWIHPAKDADGRGGYAWVTGVPPRDANPNENDVNKGRTTLTTPTMRLHRFADPVITYDLWYSYIRKDSLIDTLKVQLSSDDGRTWTTVRFDTATIGESIFRPLWRRDTIRVANHLAVTPTMKFRVVASDTLGNASVYAGLDNFKVSGTLLNDTLQPRPGSHRTMLRVTPNPSRGSGKIVVGIPPGEHNVRLEIFNEAGQQVALHEGIFREGEHSFDIDEPLDSGWYAVQLVLNGEEALSTTMLVLH